MTIGCINLNFVEIFLHLQAPKNCWNPFSLHGWFQNIFPQFAGLLEWTQFAFKLDHTLARKNDSPTQGGFFFYPRNAEVIWLHAAQRTLALKQQTIKQRNKQQARSSEKWQAHDTEHQV